MSQSGYTPIQLYRTTTAAATPTAGNLAAGELAINLTDEKLYFKNAGGTVKLLASTDTLGTVTSVAASGGTTGLTFSGSPITTSGTLTLGGTLGVANGGTGTTTAFTTGSVVFAGTSGVYSQDNTNLFWDNANDRLGIGTSSPAYRVTVQSSNAAAGFERTIVRRTGDQTNFYRTSIVYNDSASASGPFGAYSSGIYHEFGGGFGASGGLTFATNNADAGPITFATSDTTRLSLLAAGGITSESAADAVGYKGLPQNSQTSSYTLALSDMGKHISITTGGVVIPANGSVAFPIGATIVVFNNSGSTQTISITTDTLRQAGTTNTGSRTLAVYGLATLVKVTSTVWAVTGNVT